MIRSISPCAAAAILAFASGCSLGQGTGEVRTDELFAHDCWGANEKGMVKGAPFDLVPDFFAAIPYRSTLQIRVQRGNDLEEVSDGLNVLIDDVEKVREQLPPTSPSGNMVASSLSCPLPDAGVDIDNCPEGSIGFPVALPAGVTPPGSPAVPPPDLLADPPLVHADLYLHHSCHNQNTVLYAVAGKLCLSALFDGDPNEASADKKLTYASLFSLQVGDLRDVPLGMYPRDIPSELQTTIRGCFQFYFERGQPGQPFP